ncbi:TIGR00341 family protein [Cesiribacter sp. SM1]|uniref:TIGR00341 family protein n=1 Tax=Cesiribacter sp. SM1 TaxID=2861196 RepID=UPI001CD59D0F|nr:TIGR00341 family protein [Cesiribacter sp. SM1]
MKSIVLLYDESMAETVKDEIIPLFQQHLKIHAPFKNSIDIHLDDNDLIVTYLPDELLKELLPIVIDRKLKIGFLPHPAMLNARLGFGISEDLEVAVNNIIHTDTAQHVDMLMVNGRPSFDTVVIGQSLSFVYGSTELKKSRRIMGKVKNFFRLFKSVQLKQYTLEFQQKGHQEKQTINTAALGMFIVQHGGSSLISRKIIKESFSNDGMMNSLVLAPESVLGLVKFGLVSLFQSQKNTRLPPFAAHIRTNKIKIYSKEPMNLSVDNALLSAKEVELEVVPKVIQVVPGVHLKTINQGSSKEVFKVQMLPIGEQRDELLKGPLPLINHATTDQFKDLFTTLRENARPTSSYLVLMFLSTFIATLGLFGNSSPVVIGAMILAPLMSPIISLAMGVLRQDNMLIRSSLKSIGYGMLVGYLCAILITLMTPLTASNSQILSRIRPNLLDLWIAVGSGIAGAYAHAKKEIAKTLAGVAIAVALVPPLAVSGIGVGWMNWNVFSGALLLLMTNLAGIVFAAAITFLFLGFSPFRLAKKGLIISVVFMLGISAPLAFGFSRMVKETRITQNLNGRTIDHMVLRDVSIRKMDPLRLSVTIFTDKPLDEVELRKLKSEIESLLDEEVELEITIGIKM